MTTNKSYDINSYENGFTLTISENYNTKGRYVFKTLDEVFTAVKKMDAQKTEII